MLWETLSAARDLGRLHDIASVLVRHGLGDLVRRMGLARVFERAGRALHWDRARGFSKEPPVHVREALEELGPTFVKIGQILAGRTDLLPPSWTEELAKLQERVHPVPFDELRPQLVEDLGADPHEVFADLDETPLAAASIAQVHRASLPDGRPIVLKVRRPGIRRTVDADLRLVQRLAELAEERLPELRRFRPRSLARQEKKLAVLSFSAMRPLVPGVFWLAAPADAAGYAHALYANLRELDAAGAQLIVVERPPERPEWLAVLDRLTRAAAGSDAESP